MRPDLIRKLDAEWAYPAKTHVTGVTGVTTSVHVENRHDLDTWSHATGAPVTARKSPGYAGYASKTVCADKIDDFEERAAIAEFCGGLPRAHAEVLAAVQVADIGSHREHIIDIVACELDRFIAPPILDATKDEDKK